MVKTSEIRTKEVVNVVDGKRLGTITDIEIDVESGKLTAIVVPGPSRFLGMFGKNDDIIIDWNKIHKIGVDVILVEASGCSELRAIDK